MPTLGDKLRELEAAKEKAEAAQAERAIQASNRAEEVRRDGVRKFFADAQQTIIACIEAGKMPPPLIMPREIVGNGNSTILDRNHRDHEFYKEFMRWALGEGLTVEGHHSDAGSRVGTTLLIKSQK